MLITIRPEPRSPSSESAFESLGHFKRIAAVKSQTDGVVFFLKTFLEKLRHFRLIFDDKDMHTAIRTQQPENALKRLLP
jgi:hypothetical protein